MSTQLLVQAITQTLAQEAQLRKLKAPTLIVWGTDDVDLGVQ